MNQLLSAVLGFRMSENLAEARRKLALLRRRLKGQQSRINRQQELIARLEAEPKDRALLLSARWSLRQLIKTHEAILREAAVAQQRTDVRLSMYLPPIE
jgi:hypothetical protein